MRGAERLAGATIVALAVCCSWTSPARSQAGYRHLGTSRPERVQATSRATAQEDRPTDPPTDASDDFARAYPAGLGLDEADDFHPAEISGLALGIGIGTQYAGFGVQVGYYLVPPEKAFALYGYAGVGTLDRVAHEWVIGSATGVMALFGRHHRWAIDLGIGMVGQMVLEAHREQVAARPLYGVSLSVGREWMSLWNGSFRLLIGVTRLVDPAPALGDEWGLALSIGVGAKP